MFEVLSIVVSVSGQSVSPALTSPELAFYEVILHCEQELSRGGFGVVSEVYDLQRFTTCKARRVVWRCNRATPLERTHLPALLSVRSVLAQTLKAEIRKKSKMQADRARPGIRLVCPGRVAQK